MAGMAYTYIPTSSTATTGTMILNSTASTTTWQYWNQAYSTGSTTMTITNMPAWGVWNTVYEETREQREARERREAIDRQRAEERRRARELANTRAEELLLSLLTDEQAASYTERGWFEVRGSRGGRWRIRNRSQSGNVDLMPEIGEEREASFCAHPPDGLPDADAHLAQMLALVTDEDGFRRVANCPYRRRPAQAA